MGVGVGVGVGGIGSSLFSSPVILGISLRSSLSTSACTLTMRTRLTRSLTLLVTLLRGIVCRSCSSASDSFSKSSFM